MNNCCLLERTDFDVARRVLRDVTPPASSIAPISTAVVPVPNVRTLVPAKRDLDAARTKAKRASKKTRVQAFVELMLAASSLLFLAMT